MLESVDISSHPLSDGSLFFGLTGEQTEANGDTNQIAVWGSQVCGYLETTEADEETPPPTNRLIIRGKLNKEYIEFEGEIFESGGSEIYVNGLSLEVESQLILESGVKGAVVITLEKGIKRSNVVLIESETSKIMQFPFIKGYKMPIVIEAME